MVVDIYIGPVYYVIAMASGNPRLSVYQTLDCQNRVYNLAIIWLETGYFGERNLAINCLFFFTKKNNWISVSAASRNPVTSLSGDKESRHKCKHRKSYILH